MERCAPLGGTGNTCSPLILVNWFTISSCMPTAKYASSWSGLKSSNGSTATDLGFDGCSSVDAANQYAAAAVQPTAVSNAAAVTITSERRPARGWDAATSVRSTAGTS